MVIYSLVPGGDFGISVVIFTIIIRFLLWPLVKKQLRQAKVMQKMQPELKKIQKKYKKNSQAQSLAMMELYKKYEINPLGSIGILLIQLPILIGMYRVVRIFVAEQAELAKYTYGFLKDWPVVKELISNPESFNQNFLGIMDLTKQAISADGVIPGLIILSLLASVLQFFISKQTSATSGSKKRLRDVLAEAGAGKEADQAEVNAIMMQKMMKFMPVMLFFIMISLPGALALYIATANAVAFVQNKLINRQDEQAEEKPRSSEKKPTAKQRADRATEAKITRIKAKDK